MTEPLLFASRASGPAMIMALVLAEIAVGGLAVLWIAPLWGRVRLGFFKLTGAVIVVCAVLSFVAARAPLLSPVCEPGPPATCVRPAIAWVELGLLGGFAALCVLWQVLLWARALRAGRVAGALGIPVGIGALLVIAADPAASEHVVVAGFQLVAGALFAGAVTDGLLLGHWHLVDRKLSREPIRRINQLFLAGCLAAAVAAVAGGTGGGEARADLSPLLGVGVLTVSIAVGLAALCALIGAFIRALIKENSIQAATGFFYLAVILALAAEFAAKVRFF